MIEIPEAQTVLIDFEISSADCFSSSSVLALSTTEYPDFANPMAIAFPIPLLEPVITATLPLLLILFFTSATISHKIKLIITN